MVITWSKTGRILRQNAALVSIYTQFQHFEGKSFRKTLWKKAKLLNMGNFTYFHNAFYAICFLKSFIATFQLSSAASLNLGRSQNGVLENGLISIAWMTLCKTVHELRVEAFRNIWAGIHQPISQTFVVFFSKICKFECNTTSDWLNHMI